MTLTKLHAVLWGNAGQKLTPELIVGILAGAEVASVEEPEDKSWFGQFGYRLEEYKGLEFRVELLSDCLDEVSKQHIAQWNEVEPVRTGLNPNYEGMLARERIGQYVLFTARDAVTKELLGNTSCYLYRSMHNGKLAAKEDTMYLDPRARKGMNAVRFFKYCEARLVEFGVREISLTVKTTNEVHKLWERQGYMFAERTYTKTFEDSEDVQ